MNLTDFLKSSYTAYHATENAVSLLLDSGFTRLYEGDEWKLKRGGKYFVTRGGSSVIAFSVGNAPSPSFRIVASHTDSPALKIKGDVTLHSGGYDKLDVEAYGGGIWYSFFDRPLKPAGRIVIKDGDTLSACAYTSPATVTVPSLAVHQNRGVNDGFSVNAQIDLQPLVGISGADIKDMLPDGTVAADLFLSPSAEPYTYGLNNELLASPRIDNLTSVFYSLIALIRSVSDEICVAACLDNEEIGSKTAQGADGSFTDSVLRRIYSSLGFSEQDYYRAMASSMMLSLDNAHATHPNHPEKMDGAFPVLLGGGIAIKSHANKAYVSEAMSVAVIKELLNRSGIAYQDFYNRSDVRSGSTLGAFLQAKTGVLAVDLGLPQLAMHSACETVALADCEAMDKALSAFYSTDFTLTDGKVKFN